MLDREARALLVRYSYEIYIQTIWNSGHGNSGDARIQDILIIGTRFAAGCEQDACDAFRAQGHKLDVFAFWVLSVIGQQQCESSILEHFLSSGDHTGVEGVFYIGE